MKNINLLLVVGILFSSASYASNQESTNTDDIQYCENIENTLDQYDNDDQVYRHLEHEARLQAVEKLYAEPLQNIPSATFSYDTIVEKLTATINIKHSLRYSKGLFTPCITLAAPSITPQDIQRFNKTNIARVCELNESDDLNLQHSPQQYFIDRLKNYSTSKDSNIKNMINDPIKIGLQSDEELYPLIHQTTTKATNHSLADMKCLELYVYPIEIFVASS